MLTDNTCTQGGRLFSESVLGLDTTTLKKRNRSQRTSCRAYYDCANAYHDRARPRRRSQEQVPSPCSGFKTTP